VNRRGARASWPKEVILYHVEYLKVMIQIVENSMVVFIKGSHNKVTVSGPNGRNDTLALCEITLSMRIGLRKRAPPVDPASR
jgi:hypothetical protein